MKKAAAKAGIRIHSVMNMDHWKYPLSSPDPAVVDKSLDGARTSLRNAHFWGADTVLIVPAVVDSKTSYRDAYTRSQVSVRKLLPLAEELRVIIASLENLDLHWQVKKLGKFLTNLESLGIFERNNPILVKDKNKYIIPKNLIY